MGYKIIVWLIFNMGIMSALYADCKNSIHAKEHKQVGQITNAYRCDVKNLKLFDQMFENNVCVWCGCPRQDHDAGTAKKLKG